MKQFIVSMGLAVCSVLTKVTTVFAGDSLFSITNNDLSAKPNTGDTNVLIIYGLIAVVALLVLILINVKGSKKKGINKENNSKEDN